MKKAINPLIGRTIAFFGVFVLFSGLIGPRIISSTILYHDGFGWYGGAGKAVLFSLIAFALLMRRRKEVVAIPAWQRTNSLWLGLALATFVLAWISVSHLLRAERTAFWLVGAHVFLWASIIFACGGCLGAATIRQVAKTYRREILLAVVAGVIFYGLLTAIYALWRVLAALVLHAVAWLLRLCGLSVTIVPPRTLLLTKFGITVAQYCSGIESLALFSGLYAVVGFLDWSRFNRRRFLIMFLPALALLFAFNILRVFVLIMAGYYINPQLAFSLFHTYAGMVFFVLYSLLFWGLAYKWMLRPAAATPRRA